MPDDLINEIAEQVSAALEAQSQSHRAIPVIAYYFKELPELERAVVEAAVACKAVAPINEPLSKYGFSPDLERAVSALIDARRKPK